MPKIKALLANSKFRRTVGYIFAFVALVYLGNVLYRTWDEVAKSDFHFEFDLPRLAISLVLLVIARGFAVEAWRRILLGLGEYFSFGFGARVWFLSNLTRYVPGNIWQVATMMALVEQRGVSKTNALVSQIIYTALALAIAGTLGVMFLFVRPDALNGLMPGLISAEMAAYAPLIFSVFFVAVVIVFALPPANRLIVALSGRIMRRELRAPTPTFARGLIPPIFSLLMWLTNGIAFYLFAASIMELPLANLPAFIAMNAGAYVIGYASFITPSGLGFREGALAWMLSSFVPMPVAVALSLVTRLWTTAGELLGVVLVWSVPEPKPAPEKAQ